MLNKFQNDVIFEVTYKNNEAKESLISIDYYQINNKLDGIDKELNSLSYESERNQYYLNNNENFNSLNNI